MPVAEVQQADVRRFLHAVQAGKTARAAKAKRPGDRPCYGRHRRGVAHRGPAGRHLLAMPFGRACAPTTPSRAWSGRPTIAARHSCRWTTTGRWAPPWLPSETDGENPLGIRAVRLLALTGCRRGEVVSAHLAGSGSEGAPAPACGTRRKATASGRWGRRRLISWTAFLVTPRARRSLRVAPRERPMSAFGVAWERIVKRVEAQRRDRCTRLRHSFATTANTLGLLRADHRGDAGPFARHHDQPLRACR